MVNSIDKSYDSPWSTEKWSCKRVEATFVYMSLAAAQMWNHFQIGSENNTILWVHPNAEQHAYKSSIENWFITNTPWRNHRSL